MVKCSAPNVPFLGHVGMFGTHSISKSIFDNRFIACVFYEHGGHEDLCSCDGCARTASLEGSTGFAFATKDRATWANAASTFNPVFAEVSINETWYSRARRCPSSRLTALSRPLSDLLPVITSHVVGLDNVRCTYKAP